MSHQNMSTKCKACSKSFADNEEFVTCSHCRSIYHHMPCAGVYESEYINMTKTKKSEWRCTECKMRTRQGTALSNRDRQPKQGREDESEEEPGSRNKNKRFREDNHNNTVEIQENIKKVLDMITEMKDENHSLRKEVNGLNNTINTLVEKVTELTKQNQEKDMIIRNLETRVNEVEQRELENNIEITNMPIQEQKHLIENIKILAQTLDFELSETDIKDVYKNHKNNIILKLNSYQKKKEIMTKTKHKKQELREKKIYVNDQLTAYNKKLLWQAKTKAKSHNWKFIWSHGGKIFMKKSENTEKIIIKNSQDIGCLE